MKYTDSDEPVRIHKVIAQAGVASRRAAEDLIRGGEVLLNGEIVTQMGRKMIIGKDHLSVEGRRLKIPQHQKTEVYALYKPKNCITTLKDPQGRVTINDFFPQTSVRLFPIGRLDKSTTGLILLTNDGETANKILKTANNNEKEYLVKVNRPIPESILKKMGEGVPILGKITKKCVVEKVKTNQFKIILTQGLNRQIRRMCDHFGYKVVSLQRIRIMNIKLDLPEGKFRLLNDQEVKGLKK